jgi:light-regulated signal transduction histidine kinase (bacteriophytochrome)
LGFPAEYVAQYQQQLKKVMCTGKAVKYESKIPRGKKWEYYNNTLVPEFDVDGNLVSILAISKEVTRQKNLELRLRDNIKTLKHASEELSHRNRQLEDFANIASHNLRSPIGNLQMLLELHDQEENPKQKEFFIEKIKEVTQRLNGTVDNLTEVVKLKSNINKKREVIRFDKMLDAIMGSLSGQIMESKAAISFDFTKCECICYPKVYLESVLMNLLTNALKYRSPKRVPEIHFETFVKKGRIVLSCQDNGIGIDMTRHGQKIFGFNKTFHKNKDARGVGLFITKNQIEVLGGSIEAISEVDNGTQFIIMFHKRDLYHEKDQYSLYSR